MTEEIDMANDPQRIRAAQNVRLCLFVLCFLLWLFGPVIAATIEMIWFPESQFMERTGNILWFFVWYPVPIMLGIMILAINTRRNNRAR